MISAHTQEYCWGWPFSYRYTITAITIIVLKIPTNSTDTGTTILLSKYHSSKSQKYLYCHVPYPYRAYTRCWRITWASIGTSYFRSFENLTLNIRHKQQCWGVSGLGRLVDERATYRWRQRTHLQNLMFNEREIGVESFWAYICSEWAFANENSEITHIAAVGVMSNVTVLHLSNEHRYTGTSNFGAQLTECHQDSCSKCEVSILEGIRWNAGPTMRPFLPRKTKLLQASM